MLNNTPRYKMNEREIDIKDIFWEIAYAWRFILVVVIIMVILCGTYGFWKVTRQKQLQNTEESVSIENIKAALTEEELDEIEQLFYYDALLEKQETYYENSVLMNLDPYEKQIVALEYCIDTRYEINWEDSIQPDIMPKLISAYREYFDQAAYIEEVNSQLSQPMETKYLSELVVFDADDSGVFTLLITGIDAEQANEIADAVEEAVESCKTRQEELIGTHELVALERNEECIVDDELLKKQMEYLQSIDTIKKNRLTLFSDLSPQQTSVYSGTVADMDNALVDGTVSIKSYLLLGIMLGILISCLWISCNFIYGRFLHSVKEIQELYAVRCLGSIGYERKQKKLLPFVDRWFDIWRKNHNFSIEEQVEQCKVRVKMLCKQEAVDKLVVITSLSLHEKERASLFELLNQLEDSGVSSRLYENVLENMESIEKISDMDHVLILEQIGNTQYKTLEEEIAVCMYYNIHLLGVLMIEREL